MPDHDMSQTACVARATRQEEHDKALKDIEQLKTKVESLFQVILKLREMCNLNRDSIMTLTSILQEHTKCLKRDS